MSKKRAFLIWLLILTLALSIAAIVWHFRLQSSQKTTNHKERITQVVLANTRTTDIPVYLSALGAVTAANSVIVRSQVNGQLMQVLFQEGQTVKAGDVLAEIDPQPYQAQLMQFEGQLARDQALLKNAQNDLKRYKTLYAQGGVSQQAYDTQDASVKQLEGTVKSDEGQVANAQVNLTHCTIRSPIDGRVGLRLVDAGNFVQAADANGLVVVNTLQPIHVVFSIPEDNVPQVVQQITQGKTLRVEAFNRTQNKLLAVGQLLTVDNQIDPATGTIKLKAEFSNQDRQLFPNQFVNVKLEVETLQAATLVPTVAIQHGTQGDFVYAYNADDQTVHVKKIVLGIVTGDDTVIRSGISVGEKVVIEGVDKLTDGGRVVPNFQSGTVSPLLTGEG